MERPFSLLYPLPFAMEPVHLTMEDLMHSEPQRVHPVVRARGIFLGLICFGLAAAVTQVDAAVTFESQQRDVMTFAVVDLPVGEDPWCTDQVIFHDSGVFAETIDCEAGEPGNHAMGLAGQLSYIFPNHFIAEGSFSAEAEISGDVEFAEGSGSSRFVSVFSVDVVTSIHLTAFLYAEGNGATNLVFRVKDGEILVYRSIHGDTSEDVDEWFTLDPGSYELTLTTSGYGQALQEGSFPAFGSFSGSIEFPTASITTDGPIAAGIDLAPIAAPNPLRSSTQLLLASSGSVQDREITVSDLSGRLIRRFTDVGPAGVTWDTRDDNGRRVAAGIYLARGRSGAATRVVVLR